MGYRKNGACGYIAANMVLAYNSYAYESGLVPSKYLDRSKTCVLGESLTNRLLEYGGIYPYPADPNFLFPGSTADNTKKGDHAVVAYGYTWGFFTGYKYKVHYGWSGHSEVDLSVNAVGVLSFSVFFKTNNSMAYL